MIDYAKIEGDEIVIRIPVANIQSAAACIGLKVTDPSAFAPHMVRELNAAGMDEVLYLDRVLDAACERAAEADAPGVEFAEEPIEEGPR